MSDFWKRKMRTFVAFFDFNKDGVILRSEWKQIATTFAGFEQADEQKTIHIETQFDRFFEQVISKSDSAYKNILTAEVMTDSMLKQRDDPEMISELKKRISNLIHSFFDMMDVNCDGYLQEDEHRRLFHQHGLPDTSFAKATFQAIDTNHDGKLSFEEFVTGAWDFFFSEDEKNPSTIYFGPLVN